ncbi:DNA methyltransferase [Companilactobacillus sp. FL22-1]|uniref:DNA methyltransferase n=1 Tax=Companilactobacillus sp. FL22-1 TaxID=3373892 RepID=UPI003754C191
MSQIPGKYIDKIKCMSYQDLLEDIPNSSIDVLLTDPPYDIKIANWDSGFNLEDWLDTVLPKIAIDGIVMIFNTKANIDRIIKPKIENFYDKDHDFTVVDTIAWGKTNPRKNIDTVRQFEFLLIAYNNYNTSKSDRYYSGDFDPLFSNEEWETAKELKIFAPDKEDKATVKEDKDKDATKKDDEHPDPKPIRLLVNLIRKYTRIDDIIIDNFSGSASIAVASYYMSRQFVACDIERKYVDRGNKRLSKIKKTLPRTLFIEDI